MIEDTVADISPDLSAAALREWGSIVEGVLRGIAHSLNNRASAISAVLDLSRDPDDESSAVGAILGREMERGQELVNVVRAIGTPLPRSAAFSMDEAAADAARVLALHADLRDRTVAFDVGAAPTRVPRWMCVRALIALAAHATHGAPARTITLSAVEEGDWILLRVRERGDAADQSPYTAEVVAAMGGELLADAFGFRIPTLAAVRRREGR